MNWDNGHLSDISDIFRTFIGHTTKAQNLSSKKTLMNFKYKKPQINADERRYVHAAGFSEIIHNKGRKAMHQESLRPLRSLRLNVISAPAHERAPPQPAPAVCLWRSAGG